MKQKRRILNERLAGLVASIRHGEMIFIAGYPSDDIPMEWLQNGLKEKEE
jgi:D-ribose pyranose/furanose isomerase RbsD